MQNVDLKINTDAVKNATKKAIETALEAIGLQAVSYAKTNLEKEPRRVDTGNLRNSLTHQVKTNENAVYVGTNTEYAAYVEYGTGYYFDENGNEKTGEPPKDAKIWWVYVKGGNPSEKNKGSAKRYTYNVAKWIVSEMRKGSPEHPNGLEAYMTAGMKPSHFLKNAIQDNTAEYKKITEQILAQNLNNT